MKSPNSPFPARLAGPSGLSFEINANGSIRRIDHADVMINLFLGNEMEGGPANLHLRVLGERPWEIPLIGPRSPAVQRVDESGFSASGSAGGLGFRLRLVPSRSETAWFWHVEVSNHGDRPVECDLIHTQDIGLAHYGAVRLNEYYVSQYVDHTPLDHPRAGRVVASRQNQPVGGRCPWAIVGSLGRGVSFATDALQFHGLATRRGGAPVALASGLPGTRLQHEHSLVCIQDEPFVLAPGATVVRGFFVGFSADHPSATGGEDLAVVDALLALPEAAPPSFAAPEEAAPVASWFASSGFLETGDPDESLLTRHFGMERRHAETKDGRLLSFFTAESGHVVTRAKEEIVLRPHGHLLRSGGSIVPDEAALTSTVWMNGVFHSMVTQGHVSINRFLSTCHSYLGLFRSHGQRVFVWMNGRWDLLGMPSAFEMRMDTCRWIYQHAGGVIEVVSTAPDDRHELGLSIRVCEGGPLRFLISHHVALHGDDGSGTVPLLYEEVPEGIRVRAIADSDVGRRFPGGSFLVKPGPETVIEKTGDDRLLYPDGVSRGQPFLCLVTSACLAAELRIEGGLVNPGPAGDGMFWETMAAPPVIEAPSTSPLAESAAALGEVFPWFVNNALVHFLSPRGLEQYSGGGWGTRDVCQGPVELWLALGRFEPVRDLLLRVFRQQNADGDWPQWFMFFERERNIRPGDSHGDIVYWPVLALAQYLIATGDAALLDERVPCFHPDGGSEADAETILSHVDRALDLILRRVIAGTSLAAYGHGDWNDSLQPARSEMRERLCSSWTVTLNHQTFVTLAEAFRRIGLGERAAELDAMAANILEEFQRVLIHDDVLAGLAYFHEGGRTDLLLHPRDRDTGLHYSLLPMIHAIVNDMLAPRQAEAHLALIRKHLLGPDGARLFDKPMAYHGGTMRSFQRAESASFFGREIGIMYTHAHIRYGEALARFGDAEGFFEALRRINPIGLRDVVPSSTLRQVNCYYSSSDAAFADRYEAERDYGKVMDGTVPLEGGWRVYSSGAGIGTRLIVQSFLGLRLEADAVVIDPVVPRALDGMKAALSFAGRPIEVVYRINRLGRGPISVNLNGGDLDFIRETNAYRSGGARVAREAFENALTGEGDRLTVWLE